MRFLWKSQLKQEKGRFVPKPLAHPRKVTRKERLERPEDQGAGRFLSVLALWMLFFGTSAYLVLFSPYLALDPPQITGLEHIDATHFSETVTGELSQKYFNLFPRARFFLVRPHRLEEVLLARYPIIQKLEITRTFPSMLEITVLERPSLVLWCAGGTCLHILENGAALPTNDVYHETVNESRTITIEDLSGQAIVPGEGVFEPDFVFLPQIIRQSLQETLGIQTEATMTVTSRFANELRVKTTAGWQIYFSTRLSPEASLAALQLLFDTEISEERRSHLLYVDLRTENRIFYRYQEGGSEEAVVTEAAPADEEERAATKKETPRKEEPKKKR